MRKIILTISILSLGLTACSQESNEQDGFAKSEQVADAALEEGEEASANSVMDRAMPPPEAPSLVSPPLTTPGAVPEIKPSDEPQGRATMPDFTYTHDYRFEGPGDDLSRMQDAHVAACDAMGQQQCRLANYSQNLEGIAGTEASLELYVASDKIRSLADQMATIARDFNGERVAANIIGTDSTARLDAAQLQVKNILAEKERLQAVLDDRRASRAQKQAAAEQLAALAPRLNQNQMQLDNVASELGFTKMDVSYNSTALFGSWIPYALIFLLLAVIGTIAYRARQVKLGEPVAA